MFDSNNTFLDDDFFKDNKPEEKPVFLTVICILSIIVSGIVLIIGLLTLNPLLLVASLLSVIGCVIMLLMKKTGFYIYVLGQVIQLIYWGIFTGNTIANLFNDENMSFTLTLLPYLIPIAFVTMFSMNYKHLR